MNHRSLTIKHWETIPSPLQTFRFKESHESYPSLNVAIRAADLSLSPFCSLVLPAIVAVSIMLLKAILVTILLFLQCWSSQQYQTVAGN